MVTTLVDRLPEWIKTRSRNWWCQIRRRPALVGGRATLGWQEEPSALLPLPHLRRFVDLSRMEWPAIHIVEDGLEIGPTCTVKQLLDFQPPPEWAAGGFLHDCVHAFLAGFKVWNTATVLGNICTSIPAGPMTTMACALEAEYTLWATDGSVRVVPAIEFVTGNNQNILALGNSCER